MKSIEVQNRLQAPVLTIKRLGNSATIKIGLESLEDANTLIFKGLILDYKIKRVGKYIPRKRATKSAEVPKPKTFFRETTKLSEPSQSSRSSQEPQTPQEVEIEDEQTTIGSRKRRNPILELKRLKGRPRFTDRAEDQLSLVPFINQEGEAIECSLELPLVPLNK